MKSTFTLALGLLLSNALTAQTTHVLTLQPQTNDGYFAIVQNLSPDEVANTSLSELPVMVWTTNGAFTVNHCYQKFDFSQLPANATIQSAYLNLYADSIAMNGYLDEPTYGTQNACGIYRVTESWDKTTLTWNTQPQYSESSYVPLPQSTSDNEDYTNINVTQMVDSMVAGNNYGFIMKPMQETTVYNSMIFYSPTATVPSKQPKLVITYTTPTTGVNDVNGDNSISVFPNPATNSITVKINNTGNGDMQMAITDCLGRVMKTNSISKDDYAKGFTVNVNDFSAGIYTITFADKHSNMISKKFVVE